METVDLNKEVLKKVAIEEGEELLHKEYSISVVPGKVKVLIGADAGSTQTRIVIVDSLTEEPDTTAYAIPSTFSVVPNDVEIRAKSETLYGTLDSVIINQKVSTETIFDKVRVVRGTKKVDFGGAENRISSSMQKITSDVFYINLVDAIGYALVQKYEGKIPSDVDIVLGVALPPDDRQSTANQNKFRKEIIGEYSWTHKDSSASVNLNIAEAVIMTEPEAFIKAYYIENGLEIPEFVLHINGGGRSIGVELLENGVPIEKASRSFYYGGTQLLDNLGNLISKTEGGRPAKSVALAKAIKSGILANGRESKDVIEYIKTVKSEFADKIFTEVIKEVFDAQDRVAIEDVADISVSGRLFDEGEYKVSIADFLGKKFNSISPSTEFYAVAGNLIPLGLAYEVYSDYSGFIAKDESKVHYLGANDLDIVDDDNTGNSANIG